LQEKKSERVDERKNRVAAALRGEARVAGGKYI
jgi:hypothetical protein